jgi:hypothetical protein
MAESDLRQIVSTLRLPAADLDRLSGECFQDAEALLWAGRRPASRAGLVAAKQALAGFFAPVSTCAPRDFRLAHRPDGRPYLAGLPAGLEGIGYRLDWCDVSISHSRRTACALVAGLDPASCMSTAARQMTQQAGMPPAPEGPCS